MEFNSAVAAAPSHHAAESIQKMPDHDSFKSATARIMRRSLALAACSDSDVGLSRLFCSEAMAAAHACVGGWMRDAGMQTRVDGAGNLIGSLPSAEAGARTLLIGSHLDTVINAGRFDGALGVLLGIGLAEVARADGRSLPFAIDVVGFSEEEGVRYQTPYIGSRAIAGALRTGDPILERLDGSGVRMADALAAFGGAPERLTAAAYDPEQVVAFIEPHIEQGPVLEERDAPVGVVTSVAGQSRACFRFLGDRGHAGTVPMPSRRDPMPAAARFVTEVEQIALAEPGALATVGRLEVTPNVANVIPEEVAVRVDLRHGQDGPREACFVAIHRAAMAIAEQRGIACRLEWCEQQAATPCDGEWVERLAQCVAAEGCERIKMTSGAGHDLVAMAPRFPSALLFLRCGGGLSHHPDEAVSEPDVEVALRVLWRAVVSSAEHEPQASTPIADPA